MKLLNPEVRNPFVKFHKGATKSKLFEVRDKKFLYDGNSMDVFEVEDENEASEIELFDGTPQFPHPGRSFARVLVIEATHFCDLKCTYCFVDHFYEDKKTHMSLETAIDAFNGLVNVEACKQVGRFQTGFFGGEPLVNWDMIKRFVPYVNGVMHPVKVNWSITTNGILITEEIAKFMIAHGFSSIISLDGPKDVHDRCRVYKDGRGSFDDVIKGLTLLKSFGYGRSTLRSTFLPGETRVLDRVKFLNDICDDGMGGWVSVEPACLTESRCISGMSDDMVFTKESVRALESEYLDCADWFIERVNAGKKPRFHNLAKPVERLLYHIHSPSECGAGNGYLSVNPLGEVYACFTGETKVSLVDGTEEELQNLVDRPDFWVYSYDKSIGRIVPKKAICRKTRKTETIIEVELDNGEKVLCTPDHKWMVMSMDQTKVEMVDGEDVISSYDYEAMVVSTHYCEAKDLEVGDSLFPLYKKLCEKKLKGYELLFQPMKQEWNFTHRQFVSKENRIEKGVVHHLDFNPVNNCPDNLQWMTKKEHMKLHSVSDEGRERRSAALKNMWKDPEKRSIFISSARDTMKRQLADPNSKLNKALKEQSCAKDPSTKRYEYLHSEEHCKKMKEINVLANIARTKKGRSHSKETREKMSKTRLGRKHTEATKQKMRDTWKEKGKIKVANHKVVSVRIIDLDSPIDVYCLEVESTHNFALSAGVFVHNCHREINSKIGDMSCGGINECDRAKWLDNRSYLSNKCNKCAMQWHCGGGCREAAIGTTNNIHVPDPIGCEFRALFFKAALWILANCDRDKLMEQIPDPVAKRMKQNKGENFGAVPKHGMRPVKSIRQ